MKNYIVINLNKILELIKILIGGKKIILVIEESGLCKSNRQTRCYYYFVPIVVPIAKRMLVYFVPDQTTSFLLRHCYSHLATTAPFRKFVRRHPGRPVHSVPLLFVEKPVENIIALYYYSYYNPNLCS